MKSILFALASLVLVACGTTPAQTTSQTTSQSTLEIIDVAVCENKYIGGYTGLVQAVIQNGKVDRLIGANLEVVLTGEQIEMHNGDIVGPRGLGFFNSGSIKASYAAGRNVEFRLKNNGGMIIEESKQAITNIVFDTVNQEIGSLNLRITILQKRQGKLEERNVFVEDCEFPNFDKLARSASN